jgi:hypothetical protein
VDALAAVVLLALAALLARWWLSKPPSCAVKYNRAGMRALLISEIAGCQVSRVVRRYMAGLLFAAGRTDTSEFCGLTPGKILTGIGGSGRVSHCAVS